MMLAIMIRIKQIKIQFFPLHFFIPREIRYGVGDRRAMEEALNEVEEDKQKIKIYFSFTIWGFFNISLGIIEGRKCPRGEHLKSSVFFCFKVKKDFFED